MGQRHAESECVKQGSGKAEHAVTPTIQSTAVRREREQSRKEHRRHCSPGDAACCLLASRGRQAVSQPCRRTVSDHAWLVLGRQCQCDMTGGMHPVAITHRSLHGTECLIRPQDLPSLRLREPTPTGACNPLVCEASRKSCTRARGQWRDDGCGAHGKHQSTSILWGWMAPCSLQRRPNGAKILILFMARRALLFLTRVAEGVEVMTMR
jgi:hypothetical protein